MKIFRTLILVVTFFITLLAQAQVITGASGVIIDAETGETLPAVQVYFVMAGSKPTGFGTTSDLDGNFSITNPKSFVTLRFQMMGYKPESITLVPGRTKTGLTIRLTPESYTMEEVVVKPKNDKQRYKRKGNPAVELIKNVIAHKDSNTLRTADKYKSTAYARTSFALDEFRPNFEKGIWKDFNFIRNYLDTTDGRSSLTVSIREDIANDYYTRSPYHKKRVTYRQRLFGLEDVFSSDALRTNLEAVFTEIDINDNSINLLFNRFVSPLSSTLAISYYQYYIQDTIMVDGEQCIDLAFVPVNSESYSFTGHLYIVNDSTYKIKKYQMKVPQDINLNFVSDVTIDHTYTKLDNGIWVPDRMNTSTKFYLLNKKKVTLIARQTRLYRDHDFDAEIDPAIFSNKSTADTLAKGDTISIREDLALWERLRPEPLSFYESSVMDLLQEFKETPKFNALIMTVDALTSEYIATTPSTKWGESKWDFGPIYNTVSWNPLEGVRLRIGGMSTAKLHPQFFFQTYVAFGLGDLRPKYNATLLYSFIKKKYQPFEPKRHYISLSAQYEVEEPCQMISMVDRDNILMSIPTGKPVMKNYQYVFRARAQYMKEWDNHLSLKANFDFENNEAAGALSYDRVISYMDDNSIALAKHFRDYHAYELGLEMRYMPGKYPINRQGIESPWTLEQDAPVISLTHRVGYLDDRNTGGKGFVYNITEATAEKRFWFSSFGHLDTRLQVGYIWNQVPFTKLFSPTTSTSIFLGRNSFNLMQPMEFMMDRYVALYATYFFKGWILNRIPYLNRTKLRGVLSFAGIYGYMGQRNNPYIAGNQGLYTLPNNATYDAMGKYESGYTVSPIGALPYMEITAGIENIFKFIRIDYVRRLTYNDYMLPDGIHRRQVGAWGRNGVKVSIRFSL